MLDASSAASVLRPLRSNTAVLTPEGPGVVMCSARGCVTVLLGGRLVVVFALWDVEPIVTDSEVEYTDEDLAWFRKPVRTVSK